MGKVLHASYSGWFPYCLNPFSGIEPFISTSDLLTAMRLFWRIRRIRFYGTYEPTPPFVGTRNWQMVVVSAADTEEKLVCNPGWIITEQENLINEGGQSPINSTFGLGEVTSFGNEYVVEIIFGGFFQDTFGPAGWLYKNPSLTESMGSIAFEGITMWGENYGTFNYEIQEYWSYDGTYDEDTGEPL